MLKGMWRQMGAMHGGGGIAHGMHACAAHVPAPPLLCCAVENDDRPGMYSISDLLPLHQMAGTPLVFDYLHHALAPGKLSEEEALLTALDTWPQGVRPVVHYRWGDEGGARRCAKWLLGAGEVRLSMQLLWHAVRSRPDHSF